MNILVLLVLVVYNYGSAFSENLNEACTTPNSQTGACVGLDACPFIQEIINRTVSPEEKDYIEASKCGLHNGKTLVCCPGIEPENRFQSTQLLQPPECGQDLSNRIFGGNVTKIDEFPWLALIQYDKGIKGLGFHCGGSLINELYVLTAAHCIKSVSRTWTPIRVRLGEWDLNSDLDCADEVCSDPVQDIDIESVIVHEEYQNTKGQYNDIALIRLKQPAVYSTFVMPICLPINKDLKSLDHAGINLVVAGWGRTENASRSQYKLKVDIDGVGLEPCAKAFSASKLILKDSQVCAGGVQGKDSCNGDSGGPLLRRQNPSWFLVGIVSFGPRICGTDKVPGVYTKVGSYIDWIESKLLP